MKHYLILAVFSLFALFAHGYQYAVSDQEIFIPYVLKLKDPTLFANDQLFNQPSAGASLFYPIFGLLAKAIDLEAVFFLNYLIFQFFFFLAIYRLSHVILKDQRLAYLALLPFFLPKFVGGTATLTFDTFFGYRSVGVIFMLLYLGYLLERRFLNAAVFALTGFIFHPLSIIPVILLFPVIFVKDNFKIRKRTILIILSIILLTLLLFSQFLSKDTTWLSIIKFRDDYLFPSTWSPRAWLAFALYGSLLLLFLKILRPKIRELVLLVVIISLSFFVTNYLILEVIKSPSFAQFQLVRSISPIAYISLAMSPLLLNCQRLILRIIGIFAFIFLSLNFFNLYLLAFLFFGLILLKGHYFRSKNLSSRFVFIISILFFLMSMIRSFSNSQTTIQFPKAKDDWIDLQLWAKNNTSKEAIFLVPPYQTGFRIFSQRPIVTDIKDGAVVMYSPTYAMKWSTLMQDLSGYDNFQYADFKNLDAKYNFDYLVTLPTENLNFEKVYENTSFIIYKI